MEIGIVNMSNYVSPVISETRGKKWVSYGEDNDYFDYLLDRYRGSATNHAIINGISEMIAGEGLAPLSKSSAINYAKTLSLFKNEDIHRWAFDLKCLGYFIMTLKLKDGATESVGYTPVQNWRSGLADENGVVLEMFYSDDWKQINKAAYKPQPYNVLQPDSKNGEFIFAAKPFRSGTFYYPNVDYMGVLQYAHLEEEIGNFHLNNIMNGLSPSMLINFNNGDPGEIKRNEMEAKIKNKWGGSSNSGKFILAFNDDKESAATIETADISDLDKQYQFLSSEATSKILLGHRITSPLLFGIRDGSGLGSNTDEIKTASAFMNYNVIHPYQNFMISTFEHVLSFNSIATPMRIRPLQQLSSDEDLSNPLDDFIGSGESVDMDKWDLISESKVNYETDDEIYAKIQLASVPSSKPNSGSEQDNELFKVRYVYSPSSVSDDSREFCRKMVSAKKVYRKEDIDLASTKPVNKGWGAKGADTYDIFLYKGGGDCHHYWMRQVYLKKNNKKISVNEATKMINELDPDERDDVRIEKNDPKVAKLPKDMKNRGFLKPRK